MKNPFTKHKTSNTDGQEGASKKTQGISLISLSLVAVVIAALVVLLSGLVSYLQYVSVVEGRQLDRHDAEVRRMAAQLSGRMAGLGDEAGRLASADSVLLDALSRADRFSLRVLEQRIQERYPELLQVRFILPGDQRPEDGEGLGLGYASLDLARIAEAGQVPPIELHRASTAQQHLAVVRPVRDQQQVVASLILMFDPSLLEQWMAELEVGSAFVELTQQGQLQLAQQGNPGLRNGSAYYADIAGTSWQLGYWPSDGMTMDTARQAAFITSFVVAASVLVGFLVFFGLFVSRFVRADMRRMVTFIVDSSLGKRFHSYPVKLAEAKGVLQEKESDLSVLSSSTHVLDSFHDMGSDTEIPDMLFGGDEGIVVEEEDDNGPSR